MYGSFFSWRLIIDVDSVLIVQGDLFFIIKICPPGAFSIYLCPRVGFTERIAADSQRVGAGLREICGYIGASMGSSRSCIWGTMTVTVRMSITPTGRVGDERTILIEEIDACPELIVEVAVTEEISGPRWVYLTGLPRLHIYHKIPGCLEVQNPLINLALLVY